jgi:hypothetical protein
MEEKSVSDDEPIIVVSGLPRSGTSLMMQILRAGGVPVLTDNQRPPDISNPRGYFEYEKVKWLAADNSWLGEARGQALKVIAQLVPFLPRGLPYQFLFMQRDLPEVIRSQSTMIQVLGKTAASDTQALSLIFERNLATVHEFIRQLPLTSLETVNFHELIAAPEAVIDRLVAFLSRPNIDRQAMIGTVDGKLYRSRYGELPH